MEMTQVEGSIRQPTQRTAVLVLGMHRSGTSALAGVLAQLGCDLPKDLMAPHSPNPKGYFESNTVRDLNNAILESAGSTWDDWLPFSRDWLETPHAEMFKGQAIDALGREFGQSPLFVLKDPRICRLLPFWRGVLEAEGIRPVVVHIHRGPQDVGQSLYQRNGIEPDLGRLIWLGHVLSAEHDSRGMTRSFTSYDRLLDDWAGVVEGMSRHLGFRWPRLSERVAAGIGEFLLPSLRHNRAPRAEILTNHANPAWLRDVYGILESWVAEGERPQDFSALDAIREEFASGITNLSPLIGAGVRTRKRVGAVQAELSQAKSQLEEGGRTLSSLAAQVEALQAECARLNGSVVASEQALSELQAARDARVAELERDCEQGRSALARASESLEALRQENAQLRSDLGQRGREVEAASAAARDAREALKQREVVAEERREAQIAADAARNVAEKRSVELTKDNARLSTLLDERDRRLSEEQLRERELTTQLSVFSQVLAQKDAVLAALSRDLDELRSRKEQERVAANEEIGTLKREHGEAIRTLSGERDALRQSLDDRFWEISELAKRIFAAEDASRSLPGLKEELSQKSAALESATEELADARSQLEHLRAESEVLKAGHPKVVAALSSERDALKQSLDERFWEIAELTKRVSASDATEQSVARLTEDLSQKEALLAQAMRDLEGTRSRLEEGRVAAQHEIDTLKRSVDERFWEIAELTKRVSAAEKASQRVVPVAYDPACLSADGADETRAPDGLTRFLNGLSEKRITQRVEAFILRGGKYKQAEKWLEACNEYRQALLLRPSLFLTWVQLGHCYRKLGRSAAAENAYRNAIVYAPAHADAWYFWGVALQELGQLKAAKGAFLHCSQIDPNGKDGKRAKKRSAGLKL
ncbi:hypothetical protein [Xanthobacter sp. ZOL 2024]